MKSSRSRTSRRSPLAGALLTTGVLALGFLIGTGTKTLTAGPASPPPPESAPGGVLRTVELDLPAPPSEQQAARAMAAADVAGQEEDWQTHTVRTGDSLSSILSRAGVSTKELYRFINSNPEQAEPFVHLRAGQILHVRTDGNRLLAMTLPIGAAVVHRAERTEEGFRITREEAELERRIAYAGGTISGSLFLAGQEAGLSDKVLLQLARIFGWDIDFARDLRPGDQFAVLYEERYRSGEKIGDGDIVAAEFTSNGTSYQAIRYRDADGNAHYYTPDGRSMRKAFLRTPLEFTRISSGFNLKRKHPVLNRIRAHRGVDYAAPHGTPINTTGNGRIAFLGRKGGYGNTIIVDHGNGYTTLYAHLSRFAKGLRTGSRVTQGQTIAYVGSSGLATGPHLHYEFRIEGAHRNPLTVKLPNDRPLASEYREAFGQEAEQWLAQLSLRQRTQLALHDTP